VDFSLVINGDGRESMSAICLTYVMFGDVLNMAFWGLIHHFPGALRASI
jgi:hypothetical protein